MKYGIEWIDIRLDTLLLLCSTFSICNMQKRDSSYHTSKSIFVVL